MSESAVKQSRREIRRAMGADSVKTLSAMDISLSSHAAAIKELQAQVKRLAAELFALKRGLSGPLS